MKLFALYGDLTLATQNFYSGVAAAREEMNALKGEMGQTQSEATKTGSVMEGALGHALGDILSGITEAAIEAAFALFDGTVDLASSAQEIQNVVDTTFGADSARRINSWAKTTKEAYGIGSLSAKDYASTMGSTLKGLGIYEGDLYAMSTALVGLAGDMASFRNLDTETAFRKILSGMTGESEPLKELGILMNATNLASHALAMGIEGDWSKLDSATQTQVRFNYLMQQTADMQGDFSKTSESYANQMRLLQENFEQLRLAIGESILPVMTELVSWFNTLFGSQETAAETAEQFADGLSTSFADISVTTENALALVNALDELSASTEDAASTEMWGAILSELQRTLPGIGSLIDAESGKIKGGTEALREYVAMYRDLQREIAVAEAMQDYQTAVAQQAKDIASLQLELYTAQHLAANAEEQIMRTVEEARNYLGLAGDATRGQIVSEVALAADNGDLVAQYYAKQLVQYGDAPDRIAELESQIAVAEAEFAELQARYETMSMMVDEMLENTGAEHAKYSSEDSPQSQAATAAAIAGAAPAPVVNVSVVVDGQELSAIVTTEVDRAMARHVAALSR